MLSDSVEVLLCADFSVSVTWKVTDIFDAAVAGVPVMAPVEALRERPAGNAPPTIDQLYGAMPPVAARVVL